MRKIFVVVMVLSVAVMSSGCGSRLINSDALGQAKASLNKLKKDITKLYKGGNPETPQDMTAEADEIMDDPSTLTVQKSKKALMYYNKSIEIDPNYAPAYKGRGLMKMVGRVKDQALLDFVKACELGDKDSCEYADELRKQGIK